MRRPGTPRAQALILCLTLLFGGFGLPLLDAAWFHSTPAGRVDRAGIMLEAQHGIGVAHALGCALLTSATSGRGLPALGTPTIQEAPRSVGSLLNLRPNLIRTADSTLSLPRAPPSA